MLHSTTMTVPARWLAALALLLTLWATQAQAALSAADERGVREVVQAQLAAFAGDDAEKAFSYAAPNIRQSLGTAERFMAMVRSNYAVVYRPASVTLLRPEGAKAGEGAEGEPVIGALEGEDAGAARREHRRLESGLDGIRSR